MLAEALDMRKFALAFLIAATATLPAFGEKLPTVLRGGGSIVHKATPAPAPPPPTIVICITRLNSISAVTVTRCRTVDGDP
jgi:hypothetical protein